MTSFAGHCTLPCVFACSSCGTYKVRPQLWSYIQMDSMRMRTWLHEGDTPRARKCESIVITCGDLRR